MPDLNPFAGLANEATLATLSGKFTLGSQPMASSVSVTLANNQSALPVTGTFWQATQPVSGTVAISNASIPVTGTFWQATQPVSGTVAISNATIAVTGTFWQATQPVSGTVTANVSATASAAAPTYTAGAQPLSVDLAGNLRVVTAGAATEATLAALNTKTPALGAANASAATPVVQANDLTVTTTGLSAANVDLIGGAVNGWYDAAAFHSVAVQIIGGVGITAGQIIFEQTNDITTAAAGNVWPVDENTSLTPTPNIAALAIAASSVRMFSGQIVARYVRVRISTAFTGGTVGAVAVFSQQAYVRPVQTIHQATAGNLNATVSGTVTANVAGAGITGGTISPLTVAGVTVETSAARTATANGTTITNASSRGAHFFFNISAVSGTTPSVVFQLQYQDPVSLNFVDVSGAATASITTVSTVMLSVVPGIVEAANTRVNSTLPRVFRWRWTIAGTTPSLTFSVGASYVL